MTPENQAVSLTDQGCSDILKGLVISSWQPDVYRIDEDKPVNDMKQLKESLQKLSVSNKMFCSVCNAAFHSREQQTEHYKLDWHRFNLKQKLMGGSPVDEEVFEAMTGDISSISGSDDDDEDVSNDITSAEWYKPQIEKISAAPEALKEEKVNSVNSRRSLPKVFFKNHKGQLVAVYRCLLQCKKEGLLTQSELVTRATNLPSDLKWTILMAAGGHFAAAIFKGEEVIRHKTFHRYTVRAKRGTAQGIRDNMHDGNQPKSAGASLRRYNEMQMHEDVGNLLKNWQDDIAQCSCIFIRAPSYNKSLFFGGKNPPMKRDDDRIRTIPFPTRRPTFKEVQRVRTLLNTVDCFDNADAAEKKLFSAGKSSPEMCGKEEMVCQWSETDDSVNVTLPETKDKEEYDRLCLKAKVETVTEDALVSSPEEEIEFVLEEVSSFTSDLKETEVFIPKQRKKKKKKSHPPKIDYTLKDKQLRKLQAAIFTCCKTGDDGSFDHLMMQLRVKLTQDIQEGMKLKSEQNDFDKNIEGIQDACDGASLVQRESKSISANIGENESLTSEKYSSCEESCKSNVTSVSCRKDLLEGESGSKCNILVSNRTDLKEQLVDSGNEMKEQTVGLGAQEEKETYKLEDLSFKVANFLNEKLDGTENTFLHIAAQHGQVSLLWKLMSNGTNPSLKNGKGLPPYAVSRDKLTRQEFRRFYGEFPTKYDYKTAQIPAPLTTDQEEERAVKIAERRKLQKKAKKIKQKEQKEELQRQEEELQEKQLFASLTDREKRALAAEKRLANQLSCTDRCFSCGVNLLDKVPFHYKEFRFCSMQCLKDHKKKQGV